MVEFKIFAEGRWRAVDATTGRVEGWSDAAQWVTARGGALRAVPAARVLAALRALAAGRAGPLRRGPHLPLLRTDRDGKKKKKKKHHRCQQCQHRNYDNSVRAANVAKCDASIQTDSDMKTTRPTFAKPLHRAPATRDTRKAPGDKHTVDKRPGYTIKMSSPKKVVAENRSDEENDIFQQKTSKTDPQGKPKTLQEIQNENPSRTKPKPKAGAANKLTSSPTKKSKRRKLSSDTLPVSSQSDNNLRKVRSNGEVPAKESILVQSSSGDSDVDPNHLVRQIKMFNRAQRKRPRSYSYDSSVPEAPAKLRRSPKKVSNTPAKKIKSMSTPDLSSESSSEPGARAEEAGPTSAATRPHGAAGAEGTSARSYRPALEERRAVTGHSLASSADLSSDYFERPPAARRRAGVERRFLSDSPGAAPPRAARPPRPPLPPPAARELLIDEDDVALLRRFIGRHCPAAQLARFDADDAYKRRVFFRINPLVCLARHPAPPTPPDALREFASQLGLRSVTTDSEDVRQARLTRSSRSRTQDSSLRHFPVTSPLNSSQGMSLEPYPMRNRTPERRSPSEGRRAHSVHRTTARDKAVAGQLQRSPGTERRTKSVRRSEDETRQRKEARRVQRSPVKQREDSSVQRSPAMRSEALAPAPKWKLNRPPRRSSVPAGRAYSALEDHAIVSWLSGAPRRERAVNGNRVWRELQPRYPALTGVARSWHSLRNRYLRYILPSLAALALDAPHAARLRAAASTGELKARKKQRENSLLVVPAVRSAYARRPRPQLPRESSDLSSSSASNLPPTKRPRPSSSSPAKRPRPSSSSPAKRPRPPSSFPVKRPRSPSSSPAKRPHPRASSPAERPPPASPSRRPSTPPAGPRAPKRQFPTSDFDDESSAEFAPRHSPRRSPRRSLRRSLPHSTPKDGAADSTQPSGGSRATRRLYNHRQ